MAAEAAACIARSFSLSGLEVSDIRGPKHISFRPTKCYQLHIAHSILRIYRSYNI